MTSLKEYRNDYYEASGTTSTITRQLSLAGIAIIWVFKEETDSSTKIPMELFLPGLLIVVSLLMDLLQYALKTLIWGRFSFVKEQEGYKPTDDFMTPDWFNWPALMLFWLKIPAMLWAYILLGQFLYSRIL